MTGSSSWGLQRWGPGLTGRNLRLKEFNLPPSHIVRNDSITFQTEPIHCPCQMRSLQPCGRCRSQKLALAESTVNRVTLTNTILLDSPLVCHLTMSWAKGQEVGKVSATLNFLQFWVLPPKIMTSSCWIETQERWTPDAAPGVMSPSGRIPLHTC